MMRISVCFFGITRSLRHTFPSITENVLAPARRLGDVRVYSHFFRQVEIVNRRNGEAGTADPDEHLLLGSDSIDLEDPDVCLAEWDFEGLKRHGDFWVNDFVSLRNLVHQLHSLRRVTKAALDDLAADEPAIIVFCRPDLRYHDSLALHLDAAAASPGDLVMVPRWQAWTGVNDRFAICRGVRAASLYGRRIESAHDFCATMGGPLHSERLLGHILAASDVPVRKMPARASRVRVDGTERWEDFAHPVLSRMRRNLHAVLRARAT